MLPAMDFLQFYGSARAPHESEKIPSSKGTVPKSFQLVSP